MIEPPVLRGDSDDSHGWRAAGIAVAFPVLLWGILFALLPLRMQEFALNDDWCYALGVFRFARGGGVDYFFWSSTPQFGQWLVALPVVWAAGESLAVLRLVGIVLSLAGGLALCDLLRRDLKLSDARAGFVAAVLLVWPLYFVMSGTFMTDIATLSFCLMALALWGRGMDTQRLGWIAAGSACAMLAVINRQNGITAPAAIGLVTLVRGIWRQPRWILGLGLPTVAWAATVIWFRQRTDVVQFHPEPSLDRVLAFPLMVPLQAGLALLPLWALTAGIRWNRKLLLAIGAIGLIAATWVAYRKLILAQPLSEQVPFIGNMLTPWGAFGVPILIGGRPPLVMDLKLLAILVGIPMTISGAALVATVGPEIRSGRLLHSLPLFSLLNIPFILVANTMVDRYLVFLMPGVLFLVASATRERQAHWLRGVAVLGLFGAISLGLVHDWFTWNAARWELGRRALARGIPSQQLEGGFEWNCYHRKRIASVLPPPSVEAFALVNVVPTDTVVLDSEPYPIWLARDRRQVYLVEKKKDGGPSQPAVPDQQKSR